MTVVVAFDSELYKLGIKDGAIIQLYTRNQFAVYKEQLLSPEEITRRPQGKLPLQFLKQVGWGTWDGIVGQKVYRNNLVIVPQDFYVT